MTKVDRNDGGTIDLPAGWQRCDGTTIDNRSPWAGKLTPNLNKEKRFLRGGEDADQLILEDDSTKSHTHSTVDKFFTKYHCPSGTAEVNVWDIETDGKYDDHLCQEEITSGSTGAGETKPKNMNVIFIMKVF